MSRGVASLTKTHRPIQESLRRSVHLLQHGQQPWAHRTLPEGASTCTHSNPGVQLRMGHAQGVRNPVELDCRRRGRCPPEGHGLRRDGEVGNRHEGRHREGSVRRAPCQPSRQVSVRSGPSWVRLCPPARRRAGRPNINRQRHIARSQGTDTATWTCAPSACSSAPRQQRAELASAGRHEKPRTSQSGGRRYACLEGHKHAGGANIALRVGDR